MAQIQIRPLRIIYRDSQDGADGKVCYRRLSCFDVTVSESVPHYRTYKFQRIKLAFKRRDTPFALSVSTQNRKTVAGKFDAVLPAVFTITDQQTSRGGGRQDFETSDEVSPALYTKANAICDKLPLTRHLSNSEPATISD